MRRIPLSSFVVPFYNNADTLAETIQSCLNQTEKRIELILVNDCSTDSFKPILEHFCQKDSRIQVIHLPRNLGRSLARNTGIAAAQSEILMMLDADDVAMPERAKETIKFFKKNPGVEIVHGSFFMADALLNVTGLVEAQSFDIHRLINTKFAFIGHSTMAFQKRVFEQVQYTDGDFSRNAIDDWKFQVDAYKAGCSFGAIKKPLAYYRFVPKERNEAKILELKNSCLTTVS